MGTFLGRRNDVDEAFWGFAMKQEEDRADYEDLFQHGIK